MANQAPSVSVAKYADSRKWTAIPGMDGVVARIDPIRKNGRRPDEYIGIRYRNKHTGKQHLEGCGWASAGWTHAKAFALVNEIKENIKYGRRPQSFKELQEMNQNAAEKAVEEEQAEKVRRSLESITLSEVFPLFLQWCQDNRVKSSDTEGYFRRHILPLLGDKVFAEITPEDVAKMRDTLKKRHPWVGGVRGRYDETKYLSEQTVFHIVKGVREIYNFAAEATHPEDRTRRIFTGTNPAKMTKRSRILRAPVIDNRRLRVPTDAELDVLLNYQGGRSQQFEARQIRAMVLFSLDTGARAGELCFFRKEHFNPETFACSFTKGSAKSSTTKGKRTRTVFAGMLRPEVREMLLELYNSNPESPYMFPGKFGEARTENSLGKLFRRIARKNGWNDGIADPKFILVWHSLRHRFAVDYLEMYGDIYALKNLMGHEDIETTEIYLDVVDPVKYEKAKARNAEMLEFIRAKRAEEMALGGGDGRAA